MNVEEIKVQLTELPEPQAPRASGVHVSNIIRAIAQETGHLKEQWCEEILSLRDVRKITDPAALLRISMGLAWEAFYIPTLPGVCDHPGEVELDGIYMNPDGEELSTFLVSGKAQMMLKIHEVKATYKSTKTVGDLSSQWMWLSQMMAYCRQAETVLADLHVLFICGDYKPPITPLLKVYKIEFEHQEIEDNWKLLTEYRDNFKEK